MAITQLVNKALKQVDFKIHHSENGGGSEVGSSVKSNIAFHKCGNKGHIHKYFRSKRTGSNRNPPNKSSIELTEWVTNKPVVSDNEYLATSTMTRNNKNCKCCTSCSNGNGTLGFQWKGGHDELKSNAGNNLFVFPIPLPIK